VRSERASIMDKKTVLKSCFIAAQTNVDIAPLLSVLGDHGILMRYALSLLPGTGTILGRIDSAIRDADFVCAVISPQISPNVLFEIGLAYGARKPLFLIVDKEADLPDALKDIFYVRASPSDVEAIGFNLDHFLKHSTRRIVQRRQKAPEEPVKLPYIPGSSLRGMLRAKVESLQRLEGSERALALESIVADLLREASPVVARETHGADSGADIAVWLDGIESSFENPILVEVKSGPLSEQHLEQAELQLQHYLTQTNAGAGLVVYSDPTGRRFPASPMAWPLVIRFDVRDFADTIFKGELADVLLAERNRAVHGRT
jgi:hypothetical protein